MTYTDHDRRLYKRYRSLLTTLCTSYTIMWGSSEHTKNTRSCTMTYTDHDRRLYNDTDHYWRLYTRPTQLCEGPQNTLKIHCRVLWRIPITTDDFINDTDHYLRLYTRFYTIMWGSSEYTKNTQSCTMTWTGHDRWLYKRLTLLLGLRSTGVGIWYDDHGRALPTVRIIVPSSRMVSVRPNTIAQSISDQYVIVLYPLTERAMIKWYCYANTLSPMKYTLQQHKSIRVFTYTHSKGPSAS